MSEREYEYGEWFCLGYIAASPPPPGGFHPQAVKAAREAIAELERLTEINSVLLAACKNIAQALERIPPEFSDCHRVAADLRKIIAKAESPR